MCSKALSSVRKNNRRWWKPTKPQLSLLAQAAETAEHHASAADVADAASQLSALLREAGSRAAVFSGAGISTPAGVGDYRGKSGKWTKEAQVKRQAICRCL